MLYSFVNMTVESSSEIPPDNQSEVQVPLPLSVQAKEALVKLLLGYATEQGLYEQTPEIRAMYLRVAGMHITDLPNAHGRVLDIAQNLSPTDQQPFFSGYAHQIARDTILTGKERAQITEPQQKQIDAFAQRAMTFLQDSLAARTQLPPSISGSPTPPPVAA